MDEQELQVQIAKKMLSLAGRLARKIVYCPNERSDAVQDAVIAMVVAYPRKRPGTPTSAYLVHVGNHAIRQKARGRNALKRRLVRKLPRSARNQTGKSALYEAVPLIRIANAKSSGVHVTGGQKTPSSEVAEREEVNLALGALDPREAEIIRRYLINDESQVSIANQLDMTRDQVRAVLERAMGKMKAKLGVRPDPETPAVNQKVDEANHG